MEVPKAEVGEQYTYTPITVTYCGPEPPDSDDLDQEGYLRHIRLAFFRVDTSNILMMPSSSNCICCKSFSVQTQIMSCRKASEQEIGGGFQSRTACYRALQDAFCGLYFTYDMTKQHQMSSPGVTVS